MSRLRVCVVGGVMLLLATSAHANFVDLGGGAIYDTVHDITWTQDVRFAEIDLYPSAALARLYGVSVANAGGTTHIVTAADIYQLPSVSVFRLGGTWWGAAAWTQTLNYHGTSGWRLPTEVELVGVVTDPAYPTFTHAVFGQFSYLMWTSTETGPTTVRQVQTVPGGTPDHYSFTVPKALDQSGSVIQVEWAVHDGNISAVPETSSRLLLSVGMLALAGLGRPPRNARRSRPRSRRSQV